jgi:hypothetical protein
MKKEVILAIVIGFSLGLVITFGIYTARQAFNRHQAANPSPSPTPATLPSHRLTLATPENEAVLGESTATISGTTTAKALVTVLTEADEIVVYADSVGKFSATMTLVSGANDIKIVSLVPDTNETAEAQLTLIYSTATIEP